VLFLQLDDEVTALHVSRYRGYVDIELGDGLGPFVWQRILLGGFLGAGSCLLLRSRIYKQGVLAFWRGYLVQQMESRGLLLLNKEFKKRGDS
jgi:hypothetical protein